MGTQMVAAARKPDASTNQVLLVKPCSGKGECREYGL